MGIRRSADVPVYLVKFNELAERTVNAAIEDGLVDFYDFLDLLNGVTRMNPGNYSRGNQESMLVAVRGAGLERQDASVKQVIYAPITQHSANHGRRGIVSSGYMVTCHELNFSAEATRQAGTIGVTNAHGMTSNCSPAVLPYHQQ